MSFAEQLAARAAKKNRLAAAAAPPAVLDAEDDDGSSSEDDAPLSSVVVAPRKARPQSPGPSTAAAAKKSNPNSALKARQPMGKKAGVSGVKFDEVSLASSSQRSRGSSAGARQEKPLAKRGSRIKPSPMRDDSDSDDDSNDLLQQKQQRQQKISNNKKAAKLKSENKKLRLESLLLKAKLEGYDKKGKRGESSEDEDSTAKENEDLRELMLDLQEKNKQLELKLQEKDGAAEEDKILRRSRIGDNSDDRRGEKGLGASNVPSGTSHEELSKENERLTQLLLDIGELEKLEKKRSVKDNEIATSERDATILKLQQKLAQTESELAEVTELKNAEIEVLRKQLNRAEHSRGGGRDKTDGGAAEKEKKWEERERKWKEEREGLREEIRRLNVEMSGLREKVRPRESLREEEEENLELTGRYDIASNGSGSRRNSATPQYPTQDLDSSDVASLQSIISMMRQTIDQSNREKDLLEQRLSAEQERSQMELHAFARTLRGVDDLRKSAEAMGREIRRIKVRGYRPTRSDLLGGGGGIMGANADGTRNFGELTAAVEASESMEDAIRLIESQNDAVEERRRMGVVAGRAAVASAQAAPSSSSTSMKKDGRSTSWGSFGRADPEREGGFLSFWNSGTDDEDGGKDNGAAGKEKKKKSKRKHKKRDYGDGSVLTSFF